jgi:hypothetical protein
VPRQATAVELRAAYRQLARQRHPDRASSATGGSGPPGESMAEVNEAYRVLADPALRLAYDRGLAAPPTGAPADPAGAGAGAPDGDDAELDFGSTADRSTVLAPAGPARIPWRMMAAAAVIGSAVVVVSSLFDSPPSAEPPDGLLRPGSCVAFETNGDVREVACRNDGSDIVVDVMVPLDAVCPVATVGHRDRLGLGIACIAS